MQRKQPKSANRKRIQVQLKRAVKRGDVEAPEPTRRPHSKRKANAGPAVPSSSRKLQSAFTKLSKEFLDLARDLSARIPLPRPLERDAAIFDRSLSNAESSDTFTCPRRPRWRFDMAKSELNHNEEGLFQKWLAQSDEIVARWQNPPQAENEAIDKPVDTEVLVSEPVETMPRSITYFERNLEVWRQLWRVTEISQIILVLLDCRCPLLHYPPSLAAYLGDHKHILVLTKVDIAGPERAAAWTDYFAKHYPKLRVIQVEAYVQKEATSVHQGRAHYEPHLPDSFRAKLVKAIKEIHQELLEPPEKVKANPVALQKWTCSVKQDINWDGVATAHGGKVGSMVGGPVAPQDDQENHGEQPQFLTVGVIGQPNVGKSSLLNALFGVRRVRASKTPGMTKHLQTLFWTSDVRLVDCPGLVMPNLVPMEMQVLSGILPIARISAVPSCIHFAGQYAPLEQIYKLTHPDQKTAGELEDKRTWRDGLTREKAKSKAPTWTAMDVLLAYADLRGWQTAQAGRPDIHRAGNFMLRTLAEGKVSWAFWPPDKDPKSITDEGLGIWIPGSEVDVDEEDWEKESAEADEEEHRDEGDESDVDMESDSGDTGSDGSSNLASPTRAGISGDANSKPRLGRFGALALDDVAEDNNDNDESEKEKDQQS
ncbi:hypothetical protein C8J56DRAFT_773806 [Mycena floridula]|nr:hypothetical protein C8J56DRAFT_773806 [Mycena floridula]